MMVRMFWTGCGCPSEFRMFARWTFERWPFRTAPAMVTTSWLSLHEHLFSHGSLPRCAVRESTGLPGG
jgi:hypothetical protein